jgi:hypothetical protein
MTSPDDLAAMVEIARLIVEGKPIPETAFLRPELIRKALAQTVLELWCEKQNEKH